MAKVIVTQKEGEEIATEVLATEIATIAQGIRKLRGGRLNDRALVLLIQHAAPGSIGTNAIRAVLDGIDALEATYLRKPKV